MADLDREDMEDLISSRSTTPQQVIFANVCSPVLEALSPEELVMIVRLGITGLATYLEGDGFNTYSKELKHKAMHTVLDLLKDSVKLTSAAEGE